MKEENRFKREMVWGTCPKAEEVIKLYLHNFEKRRFVIFSRLSYSSGICSLKNQMGKVQETLEQFQLLHDLYKKYHLIPLKCEKNITTSKLN